MGTNLSSKTLFHFMQNFEYLTESLNGKLYPRYSLEPLNDFFHEEVYIPMKCFCDIPLSMVKNHTEIYGEYAIGLKKEWGVSNGINPVFYIHSESSYMNKISIAYNLNVNAINDAMESDILLTDERYYDQIDLRGQIMRNMKLSFANFKPLFGQMVRGNNTVENIDFYNEREWRYLSKIDKDTIVKALVLSPILLKSNIPSEHNIEDYNQRLKKIDSLEFSLNDINFIIVKSDQEILEIHNIIDKMSDDPIQKALAKTKLIKFNDIHNNF